MTDKPTALDRLRAGLRRRNEAADDGQPPPAEEPRGETVETPDAPGPAAPQGRQACPSDEPSAAAPRPGFADRRRQMRVTIDNLKIEHEEQLSRTRRRINLRWTAAVMLGLAVLASAGYLYLSHNQEELFQRHWRAHVWAQHGGSVLACINEARKVDEPVLCRFHVSKYGPDCPPKNQVHGRFIASGTYFRCPPWEPPEGPWSQ